MEPVHAANRAVGSGGGRDVRHEAVAVLHARRPPWRLRLGYLFVAAPVTALCAGLLDGPWAAGSAYAVLLLGVASTWRAALPPRPLERVRADECCAEVSEGRGNQHEVATFPNAVMAWCGYLIVAVAATGSCYGLAGTPGAALVAYALLLLGVTSIWRAMLPPRPREEGNRGVGKGNRQGHEVAVSGAWTMAWCGCLLVAVPVLASSAGFIDGLGTTFFAYTLQLLGVAIIIAVMLLLALAKLKID
ncbi:hypothetical protein C2845_PM10G18760 [Panicum miliaceum]|uniref:Uncharacterized protein n=1 Tax=Panicum miliaceum TaxID=4540 RepID=A0A3L6PDB1_PANMI|nr:hypothetical protein C2845_PM10G18760 [Panicum miliaceum]